MWTLVLAAVAAVGQIPGGDTPYESITGDELAALIETMASDDFEGRESGTPGGVRTTEFLRREFAARGAAPGVNGSYFQPVPLVRVTRDDPGSLAIDTAGGRIAFDPSDDFFVFPMRARGPARIADAPLAFVGYGVIAPEHGWDDYAGVDVEGAVVVVLRGEPSREGDDGFFGGRELTEHYQLDTKYRRAAEQGAVGVLLVHSEASAGWPWTLLSTGASARSQMFLRDVSGDPEVALTAQITEPAAERLFEALGHDFSAMRDTAANAPASAVLGGTASMAYRGRSEEVASNNVVAMTRGREAPQECVIYTAHWDHVGINPDLEGDQIHNGAVDNATGTAGLLEIAQAYAMMDPAPRRSVYFVATAAEEKGLLGAEYLAQNPPCAPADIVAVLNMDSHFPFGPQPAMTIVGLGYTEIDAVFARAAGRIGRVLQDDSNPEVGAFFRNDAYAFAERGIPSIFAVGAPIVAELSEDSEIYRRYGDYVASRYHQPADEYDRDTWQMEGMIEDFRIHFDAGRMLANDTRFPNFRFDLPYRRIRDAMRGQSEAE
ncbi:MAG: M28 family peptidase [Parasphingopyxis sp.]|uniref:M28 family peptidase n=1 Tax=Parasphingopyxis sp. TaxID=1920299 RepID=UPI003FA12F47